MTTDEWVAVLKRVVPRGKEWVVLGLADNMNHLSDEFEINTPLRQQHFIAQCAHESDSFQTTREYASGKAYEMRRDLGNTQKGDGERFRGRGLIQLTGRANYRNASLALKDPLIIETPEIVERFPLAATVSGWFWQTHGLNQIADKDDARQCCKVVNGGYNGLNSRLAALKDCKSAFAALA